jgi:hypothetical protein
MPNPTPDPFPKLVISLDIRPTSRAHSRGPTPIKATRECFVFFFLEHGAGLLGPASPIKSREGNSVKTEE